MNPHERELTEKLLHLVRSIGDQTHDPHTSGRLVGVACELRVLLGENADSALDEFRREPTSGRWSQRADLHCPRCRRPCDALLPHRDGGPAACDRCLDESRPRSTTTSPASTAGQREAS